MTTNTIINYAKLADDAADTYTSARDALNCAIANLAVVDSDRRGYQDIVTTDGHIDVPIFNVWFTQDEKQEIAEQAVAYYRAADAYKAMAPYNRDAVTLMLIRFFERDTNEHGNLVYDNHYFNLRNLPTLHDVELNNNMRASESKFCTVDTMLTRHFYVEARDRLSKAISRATKNMQERIKNA